MYDPPAIEDKTTTAADDPRDLVNRDDPAKNADLWAPTTLAGFRLTAAVPYLAAKTDMMDTFCYLHDPLADVRLPTQPSRAPVSVSSLDFLPLSFRKQIVSVLSEDLQRKEPPPCASVQTPKYDTWPAVDRWWSQDDNPSDSTTKRPVRLHSSFQRKKNTDWFTPMTVVTLLVAALIAAVCIVYAQNKRF